MYFGETLFCNLTRHQGHVKTVSEPKPESGPGSQKKEVTMQNFKYLFSVFDSS